MKVFLNQLSSAQKVLSATISNQLKMFNIKAPKFVIQDAVLLHSSPWNVLIFNPNEKSSWRRVLEKYWMSESYRMLNEVICCEPLLAKYAAIQFIMSLVRKSINIKNNLQLDEKFRDNQEMTDIEKVINYATSLQKMDSPTASRIVEELYYDIEKNAQQTLSEVPIVRSFSHAGIPIARLLENPEEFRENISKKIVIDFAKLYSDAVKTSKNHEKSQFPCGIKRIERFSEIPYTALDDIIDNDIFAYKLSTKTLKVTDFKAKKKKYLIYIDKSGSMEDEMKHVDGGKVIKIAFACAIALAMHTKSKNVELKLFDTEVYDPITTSAELINTLLRLYAGGGTNITNVFKDIINTKDVKNKRVVIITDGIDSVKEDVIKSAKSLNLDIVPIFINTNNQIIEKYFKSIMIEKADPNIVLKL